MTLARVLVTVTVLAFLVKKAGFRSIAHQLGDADPAWLAMGFAFGLLAALITVGQWHGLLRACGLRRSYRRCLHLELAGDVFDAALPSSIGGDLLRAVMAAEKPEERATSAASVLLRRLCNFPGMIVVMAIGLIGSLGLSYSGRIQPYSVVALLVGSTAIITLVSPLLRVMANMELLQKAGPGRIAAKILTAVHEFRGRRGDIALASLRSVAFWSAVTISQWAFMRGVGIHMPFLYAALVVTTTNALTMLPISLGGYGLREGAFSAFLAVGGLATTGQGVAVGVCLTAQTMALGLIGVPFYLTLSRKRRAFRATNNMTVAA